jgi:CRISPR-associated protein Cmr1
VGLKPGPLEFRTDPYSKLYLGYGPLQLVRQPSPTNPNGLEIATSYNRNACRDALLIDSTIPTRCSFVAHGSESALRLLQASLTLLHLFGGVGARSRRAWGSVSVVGDFIPAQGPNEDISAWFARTLEGVWALSGTTLPREAKVQPRFSAFSSKTQIRLLGPFGGDYTQVLDRFYGRFKEVRLWKGPGGRPSQLARTDHDLERAAVDTPSGDPLLAVPKRLAFGLPYQPRFRDENSIAYFGRPSEESEPNRRTIDRRASPLLLKVFRVGPTSHAGVALFLQASFFGASDYAIAAKGRSGTQPFPGYAAIAEFLGTDGQPWRKIRLP